MGLKQAIVVVNEFTCKTSNGGTRGGTPGNYIIEYMNRGGATEILTPVRLNDHQNYILNYMLRDEATEAAGSVSDLKQDFRALQGQGGRAFGYGSISLSDEKLKAAAADVQKNFQAGKTVLKTVISFDEGYLREHGIVSPDFQFRSMGDYRGNIDQLKLRMAIMNGLQKASRGYDDLQYVGVIQVDTEHVHCHLAMFDKGIGTIMPDGTQRGKMTDREMRDLRRGIDMFLDEKQAVKMMVSNVQYDKQNTVGYIKRFTHETMNNRGLTQFMIACLPEDKRLWRAGSNANEMQKANGIVREYVEQVLAQPDSGYTEAMAKVEEYASYRTTHENLTGQHYRELIDEGRERIIADSMNAVYSILKQIPEADLETRTPFMDVMSMSYEDMANEIVSMTDEPDSIVEFGFRLRSYKTRLDHHVNEYKKYHEAKTEYEKQEEQGNTSEASVALYNFFQIEEEYNEMLMTKYQYFLDFIPPDEEYRNGFDELMRFGKNITSMQQMMSDTSMRRMTSSTAEDYGRRVYNLQDGHFMVTNPQVLIERLDEMKSQYADMRDAYSTEIAGYGFNLTEDDVLERSKRYSFDDVKAIDIHHMVYDFPYDFAIPRAQSQVFVNMADKRYEAFQQAKKYLDASGQEDMAKSLPETDILLQHDFAERFKTNNVELQSAVEKTKRKKRDSRTIRLDYDFYVHQEREIKDDIKLVVQNTVLSLQYE